MLTGACSPTPDTAAPRQKAPVVKERASAPQVQPVTLPDLSRLPAPVQEQIRQRHVFLDHAIERHAPAEELGRAYGDVGLLLMAAEYQAPAEACLRNAQILASTDPRWSYYLGQLYLARGDPGKASESFERALQLRPDDFPTLVRLGRAYLDQDRSDAAERVFAQAADLQPQSAAALGGLGGAILARGDAARAAEHLQRALAIEPEATSLHYPLAMAYRSLGDLKQADAQLRLRGRGEPTLVDPLMQAYGELLESAVTYQNRGLEAMQASDFSAAATHFRRALELDPQNASIGHMLGTALFQMGDVNAAIRQFEEVLRWSPNHSRALFSLGVILESQGRDQEAAARFATAVKQEPDYLDARLGLVHCLQLLGRFDETLPHYRHIVKVDPRRDDAWVDGATVLISLSRYDEARAWLAAARKVHPEQPELASQQKMVESLMTSGTR